MMKIKCDCSKGMNAQCTEAAKAAADDIAAGKLVVYPTETVYGIGGDIFNQIAVKNVFLAKKRPFDMALSVAVHDKKAMEEIAVLDDNADKLIKAFLPGPLTLIIPKRSKVPDLLTAMSQKVGIRIPDHPIALELTKRAGPIVATSANIHSRPDAVNINMAVEDLGDSVSTYIDAGNSPTGKPSTIVWLMHGKVEIVRQGQITIEQIEEVLRC
ncbi:MAG: threonylcarbamoyl-AMP synthase [Candidatus Methanomethylophilaceae archaeon]|nr:threonylcarbamoyl-AMP synthase [Candidatus Methanomethylophilaceae archaeon]